MTEASDTSSAVGLDEAARAGAVSQARMIYRAIFASPVGRRLIVLLTVLVVAILVTTYGQIILNRWNQPFYDAITRRDLNDFLYQLGVYFVIVGSLLVLDVAQRWLTRDHQVSPSRRSDARSVQALDGSPSCVLARHQRRSHGREPRPTHERRCDQALRDIVRSLDRALSFERVVGELRGRALDHFRGLHIPRRRRRLRRAGFHAVGRHFICRRGLASELFRGPEPDPAQRRPLRARGGPALRARPHQRARRRHCARGQARPTSAAASKCISATS